MPWSSSPAARATKPDAEYTRVHSRGAQEDVAGRKRAQNGWGTSAPKMLPPRTREETEAKARETIRESAYLTGSSQRIQITSYRGAVTEASSAHSAKEVDAPENAGVSNDGARAPAQVGIGSFRLPGSKAIDLQRNIVYQAAEENTQRLHSSLHGHQLRLAPPPSPAAARSDSVYAPARDDQSMESEIERLKKDLASANEKLAVYERDEKWLISERKRAEEKLQIEKTKTAATNLEMDRVVYKARTDVQNLERQLRKGIAEKQSLQRELEHLKGSTNNPRALEAKVRERESALASTMHDLEITSQRSAQAESLHEEQITRISLTERVVALEAELKAKDTELADLRKWVSKIAEARG